MAGKIKTYSFVWPVKFKYLDYLRKKLNLDLWFQELIAAPSTDSRIIVLAIQSIMKGSITFVVEWDSSAHASMDSVHMLNAVRKHFRKVASTISNPDYRHLLPQMLFLIQFAEILDLQHDTSQLSGGAQLGRTHAIGSYKVLNHDQLLEELMAVVRERGFMFDSQNHQQTKGFAGSLSNRDDSRMIRLSVPLAGLPFDDFPPYTDEYFEYPPRPEGYSAADWSDEVRPTDGFENTAVSKWENIAWYRSFHDQPQEDWGIYIRWHGVFQVARESYYLAAMKEFRAGNLSLSDEEKKQLWKQCLNLAYFEILYHEWYHFFVDLAAASLEQVFYVQNKTVRKLYVDYSEKVYAVGMRNSFEEEPHEEAMANAYAARMMQEHLRSYLPALTSGSSHKRLINRMEAEMHRAMRGQPCGYRMYWKYLEMPDFAYGNQQVVHLLLTHLVGISPGFEQWLLPERADLYRYSPPVRLKF